MTLAVIFVLSTLMVSHVAPSSLADTDLIYGILNSTEQHVFESILLCRQNESSSCSIFLHILWQKYAGHDGKLNTDELDNLLNSGRKSKTVNQSLCGTSKDLHCLLENSCFSAVDLFDLNGHQEQTDIDFDEFISLLPSIVYTLQQTNCFHGNQTSSGRPPHKPPVGQVWGFGFLCVTLINLCSLLGMVFIPFTKKPIYKKLLMFMVALGVGTLTGSSLLFLIPECFGLTHEDSPYKDDYIWKATTIIGGIYLFFLTERILQSIMDKRDESAALHRDHVGSVKLKSRTRQDSTSMNMSFSVPDSLADKEITSYEPQKSHLKLQVHQTPHELNPKHLQLHHSATNESRISQKPLIEEAGNADKTEDEGIDNVTVTFEKDNGHCQQQSDSSGVKTKSKKKVIKSVAWMIVFGDGLHNFIDGLSIGAAFSENILAGISVSLAVICEELPHELGDFAILLNSGMTVKQALKYNFLSACMCYFGLVIGIVIGEMTNGSTWIFAIAGGMFLYISLVDMLPEVNHAAQEEVRITGKPLVVFVLQNTGLLTGYGLMLFLAIFAGKIDLEST